MSHSRPRYFPLVLSLSKDERGLVVRQAHHERLERRTERRKQKVGAK